MERSFKGGDGDALKSSLRKKGRRRFYSAQAFRWMRLRPSKKKKEGGDLGAQSPRPRQEQEKSVHLILKNGIAPWRGKKGKKTKVRMQVTG